MPLLKFKRLDYLTVMFKACLTYYLVCQVVLLVIIIHITDYVMHSKQAFSKKSSSTGVIQTHKNHMIMVELSKYCHAICPCA